MTLSTFKKARPNLTSGPGWLFNGWKGRKMGDDHIGVKINGVLYVKLEDARRLREGWDKADERIEAQAAEITRLRAELATARREGMEEAAKIAEGEVYLERYRTWPWWKSYGTGNRSGNRAAESDVVIHCDAIAAAIRAAAGEMK
jgi:hypothetical protein